MLYAWRWGVKSETVDTSWRRIWSQTLWILTKERNGGGHARRHSVEEVEVVTGHFFWHMTRFWPAAREEGKLFSASELQRVILPPLLPSPLPLPPDNNQMDNMDHHRVFPVLGQACREEYRIEARLLFSNTISLWHPHPLGAAVKCTIKKRRNYRICRQRRRSLTEAVIPIMTSNDRLAL